MLNGVSKKEVKRAKVRLIKAGGSSLILQVKEGEGVKRVRVTGQWKVDAGNRLKFVFWEKVKGRKRKRDLSFEGKWSIDENNFLVYKLKPLSGIKEVILKGRFVFLGERSLLYRLRGRGGVIRLRAEVRQWLPRGLKYRVWVEGSTKREFSDLILGGELVWEKTGKVSLAMRYGVGNRKVKVRLSRSISKRLKWFVEGRLQGDVKEVRVGMRLRF